jgi:hypothetical protein
MELSVLRMSIGLDQKMMSLWSYHVNNHIAFLNSNPVQSKVSLLLGFSVSTLMTSVQQITVDFSVEDAEMVTTSHTTLCSVSVVVLLTLQSVFSWHPSLSTS